MRQSEEILVCKVDPGWYAIVKAEYVSAGPGPTNFWTIKNGAQDAALSNIKPGTLVLNVLDENDHCSIVGGGFFLDWKTYSQKEAWERFGVRNGSMSFEALQEAVRKQGGNEHSKLESNILYGTFVFSRRTMPHIPDEFRDDFRTGKSRFLLPLNEPLGHYLERIVTNTREHLTTEEYGPDWQGIYYYAARRVPRAYKDGFNAAVWAAYNFRCAVTGSAAVPVLEVANLQPCYSQDFQTVENGILLRCDIKRLLSEGFITLQYKDSKHIEVLVSDCIGSVHGEEYARFNHKIITLPADSKLWPRREFLEWHKKNCFEHWLKVGGTHS